MIISFEKASSKHKEEIFIWLEEPHVKEFWDNSQEYKDDILNFMTGRKDPSHDCNSLYTYWVGFASSESGCDMPYCLIMTLQEKEGYDMPVLKKDHISSTGTTYSIDYMIGDKNYFGNGLGAKTLEVVIGFFREQYDQSADTFFIDRDVTNPRAKHVYEKAGFQYVGGFCYGRRWGFCWSKNSFFSETVAFYAQDHPRNNC